MTRAAYSAGRSTAALLRKPRLLLALAFFCCLAVYRLSREASAPPPPIKTSSRFRLSKTPVQLGTNSSSAALPELPVDTPSETLLVYVYYDGFYNPADEAMKTKGVKPNRNVHPENLKFFLDHGLDSRVDFLLILHSDIPEYAGLPESKNIFVWRRNNSCYDTGAFRLGVEAMEEVHGRTYKRYILLNSSVRGPFLPMYLRNTCWTDVVLGMLSPTVKLVGTTASCGPNGISHVQSMMLAFDREGFETALPAMKCHENLWDAVHRGEVLITLLMLGAGHGVKVLMPAGVTFSETLGGCTNTCVNLKGAHFGMTLHPYDVIFIKANRGIDDHALATYTRWHNANPYNSCPYHQRY